MSTPPDRDHVTLFKGAADNPYFEVYFNAQLVERAERVRSKIHAVDLRPDRDVTLHVEIYNPTAPVPLIVTPGGMGECDGFRNFAINVAAAAPECRVIIWDRRNMGRSEVAFGSEPLAIEEAEDLHTLIGRLGVAPAACYGMSAGARSNMILADRHPEDLSAIVIAPLTGGPIAGRQLSEEYYLKYLHDETLTSMEALAKTPLWAAYLQRNDPARQQRFLAQDVTAFLAAMRRSGEHLESYQHKTALGMTDEQLAALALPTLILHHGDETDVLHPIPHSRAATTLFHDARFGIAVTLQDILDDLLPFVRRHTPAIEGAN